MKINWGVTPPFWVGYVGSSTLHTVVPHKALPAAGSGQFSGGSGPPVLVQSKGTWNILDLWPCLKVRSIPQTLWFILIFIHFSQYHCNFGVPFWDKWAAFLEPACCCIWFPQCDCFFGWAERRSGSLWQHPGNMISNKDLFHKMQDLHGFTSFQGQEHKENMRFQSLSQEILGVDTPPWPCNAQLQGFDVRPCKAWRVGHTCAMTQVTHGHMILNKRNILHTQNALKRD